MTDLETGIDTPEKYVSSDPEQQKIGASDDGMDSLGSYEDGGDTGAAMGAGGADGTRRAVDTTGTGSAATDGLSNSGNPVD